MGVKQFLSTPSARRATGPCSHHGWPAQISIHALREEGDCPPALPQHHLPISIHALREEGDGHGFVQLPALLPFLSTPSARRATLAAFRLPAQTSYFYPRPPRGGRRGTPGIDTSGSSISIHALREEGDDQSLTPTMGVKQFLSTPSARRATIYKTFGIKVRKYFYPRPPRGGRRRPFSASPRRRTFLSTPSARRATRQPPPPRP